MEVRSELVADSVCSSWDPSQVERSGIFGDEPFRPLLPDSFRRRVVDWSAAQDQNFRGWDFDSLMLAGVISQEVILRMLKCGFKMFGRLFFKTRFSIRRVSNTAVLGLWIFLAPICEDLMGSRLI